MSPSRTTLEPLKPLVLICSTPVSGHIIPMLTIAEQLVSRGYDVCFVTGSGYRRRVEAAGASFVSVEGYGDFYDLTSWDLDPSWPEGKKHLEGTDCFIHDLVHIFCRSIPSQHHALQTALGTLASKHPGRPTILLTESLNFAAMPILHGAPGLRSTGYMVIGLNPMMLSSIDHPPFGSGLPPDASPAGRAQHAAANAAQRETFAAAQSSYAEALAKLAAAREPETFLLDALYHLPDRFVQMCVPSVEYPRSDAPPGLRFSGGYPNGPKDPFHLRPAWWPEVVTAKAAARKLVFVCQGTVAMDLTQLVVPTMAALAGREDVLVVVAVGRKGASLPRGLEVPPNCRVTDYVPYDEVLPHCGVFVTTGGYGAFQRAVRNGTPLVVAAATEEKPETAARAAWAGVGVDLRTGDPSVEQLRRAVGEVLEDGRYKARAAELQMEGAGFDPMDVVVGNVEELAAEKAALRTP